MKQAKRPMHVRPARRDERAEVEAVGRLAFASVRNVYRPTPSAAEAARRDGARETTLVGLQEDRIVAVAAYRVESGTLVLRGLGVVPDQRQQGCARRMIDEFMAVGRRMACSELRLYTIRETGNVAVFERLGFTVFGEEAAT